MNREERKAWLSSYDWRQNDRVICVLDGAIWYTTAEAFNDANICYTDPQKLLRLVDGEIQEVPKKPMENAMCGQCGHIAPLVKIQEPKPPYQEHPLWIVMNAFFSEAATNQRQAEFRAARDWVRDAILKGEIK